MSWIRKRLARASDEAGISIVEVVVAMMVFAIIALGAGTSVLTIVKMTQDTRDRQVATNLATSELDLARAIDDPFDIVNGTKTQVVNGRTYTITRTVSWVATSGADVACGAGTGTMQSKRVNVTVTWKGMLSTTQPVRSDTLISPDDRINDPDLGTVRISVLGVDGTGSSGVRVTVTAVSGGGGTTPAVQPDNTDTDGCSYALKLKAGTYSVTLSRSNSIDSTQAASPSQNVDVAAGGSTAAQFNYDFAAKFNLAYASNVTAPKLPTNLTTTFVSTYGYYYTNPAVSQVSLHPIGSGYAGIAGKYEPKVTGVTAGCVSPDPAAWKAATVNGVALAAGVRLDNVAADPQGSVGMNVPMGAMTVKLTGAGYLFADSATAPAAAADPGCGVSTQYSFGYLTAGTYTIALPYGTWSIQSGSRSNGSDRQPVATSNLGLIGTVLNLFGGTAVTLDPRMPR